MLQLIRTRKDGINFGTVLKGRLCWLKITTMMACHCAMGQQGSGYQKDQCE
jgi:hypothetical protein